MREGGPKKKKKERKGKFGRRGAAAKHLGAGASSLAINNDPRAAISHFFAVPLRRGEEVLVSLTGPTYL